MADDLAEKYIEYLKSKFGAELSPEHIAEIRAYFAKPKARWPNVVIRPKPSPNRIEHPPGTYQLGPHSVLEIVPSKPNKRPPKP